MLARGGRPPTQTAQFGPCWGVVAMSGDRPLRTTRPLAALMLGASALALGLATAVTPTPARAQDTCVSGNNPLTGTCNSATTTATNGVEIGANSGVSVSGTENTGVGFDSSQNVTGN